jgi:hypothetical protein
MNGVSSHRVQDVATRLEQTADELASLIKTLTPEEWSRRGQNSPIWSLGADEVRRRTLGGAPHGSPPAGRSHDVRAAVGW